MSAERTNNYILNYLDEPTRILCFTPGEVGALAVCFITCVLMNRFVLGVITAFGAVILLRKIRDQFKIQSAAQFAYWFFPHVEKRLRRKVPSHISEYVS